MSDGGAVRNAGNMEDAGSNISDTSNTSAASGTGKLPIQQDMSDVTDKTAEIVLADVTSENVRAKEVPAKIPVEPEEGVDLSGPISRLGGDRKRNCQKKKPAWQTLRHGSRKRRWPRKR